MCRTVILLMVVFLPPNSSMSPADTNIYVVQKMLARKNVKTTRIYAALADETKRESVNRITLMAPELKEQTGIGE